MTNSALRHRTVAVAVIYDPQHGFLLWNNRRWGGYAFPMRHLEPQDEARLAALDAIGDRDFPLSLPNATSRDLEQAGLFGMSDGVKEDTYYDYHVVEIDPGETLNPKQLDPDVRFFTYKQVQTAANVTWSTRALAASLVETQEVCVAIISRERKGEIEFLLVYKPNHGYFFPTIRRKTHGPLEEMATQAIHFDTAYEGDVQIEYCGEVFHERPGTRYGSSNRCYRFHLCCAKLPSIDSSKSDNPLEKSLEEFQSAKANAGKTFGDRGYWSWFTADKCKTHGQISPDMRAILLDAIECAKKCRAEN